MKGDIIMSDNHKDESRKCGIGSIGGMALIEGVMMKSPNGIAMAVRKSDGEIEVKNDSISKLEKTKAYKIPVLRGMIAFVVSMLTGIKSITYSAEFFEEGAEYEEKSRFELWLENKFKDKADDIVIYFSVFLALVLAIGIFTVIPTVIVGFLRKVITNPIGLSMAEGGIKISMFLAYILIISRMKEIRRTFEYHGAEHKVIHCFESGKELTVENAKKFTTLHPRCGTSFLLIVMIISILIFSLISWNSLVTRILIKLVILPIVAGVSYEVIRIAGRSKSKLMQAISFPGLMLQKLTTREPDDEQLEVALVSLKSVLEMSGTEK